MLLFLLQSFRCLLPGARHAPFLFSQPHDFLNLHPKLWVSGDLWSGQDPLLARLSTVVSYAPKTREPGARGEAQGSWAQEGYVSEGRTT